LSFMGIVVRVRCRYRIGRIVEVVFLVVHGSGLSISWNLL
jgi:hypothetical protein